MWSYSGCCRCWYGSPYPDSPHHYPPHHHPHQHHHHDHHHDQGVPPDPKELIASSAAPDASAQIGGVADVLLSLDFLKDTGAESPTIKVTVTDASGSGVWTITTIGDGFQDRNNFLTAASGAKVDLSVAGCTAQLSWFETQA